MAQPRENVVDWARGGCKIIEEIIEADPIKPDEVDWVEILGFMDGVRVVKRLKKKLDEDVELYGFGAELKPCPESDARTISTSQMGHSDDQELEISQDDY